jgi:hypothetical protein
MEFHSSVLVANNPGAILDAGATGSIIFHQTLNSGDRFTFTSYADAGIPTDAQSWNNAFLDAIKQSPCLTASANNCSLNTDGSIDTTKIGASYLAVIGSAFENGLAGAAAGFQRSWLGGAIVKLTDLRVNCSSNASCNWATGSAPTINSSGGVVGPYIWTAGSLLGQAFFQQLNNGDGTGNILGYTNWNNATSTEPNNYNLEWALQFVGSGGLWNNLMGNTGSQGGGNWPVGYVVQTNLAPSALKINANNVTFSGAVGSIKPLSTLTVTAPTINVNGGSIITTGTQNYSNGASSTNLNLGASNTELRVISQVIPNGGAGSGYTCLAANGCLTGGTLSLDNVNINYDGNLFGAGALTLRAFNDVILGPNATISATNNKLDLLIKSGDNSFNNNAAATGALNATGGAIALSAPVAAASAPTVVMSYSVAQVRRSQQLTVVALV